ncbi:MAG: DUF2892 domain-containing protein [Sedimenticolaceae bacterium]
MTMTKNIGTIDRTLRVIVGLALIALSVTGTTGPWGWIGIVPLVTALVSWCPAYTLLGIKTCKSS